MALRYIVVAWTLSQGANLASMKPLMRPDSATGIAKPRDRLLLLSNERRLLFRNRSNSGGGRSISAVRVLVTARTAAVRPRHAAIACNQA